MANDITLPGTGLVVDTVEQSDGSHQQVVQVDGAVVNGLNATVMLLKDISDTLGRIIPDASGRNRIFLESIANNITLGTVGAVTDVSFLSGLKPVGSTTLAQSYGSSAADLSIAATNNTALVNYSFITVS